MTHGPPRHPAPRTLFLLTLALGGGRPVAAEWGVAWPPKAQAILENFVDSRHLLGR